MATDYKLKTTINKFPPGTPVKIVLDPRHTVELGTSYDIVLPDGTLSWAYLDEIEWSEECLPLQNTPTSAG
jgi:hypothetical protein